MNKVIGDMVSIQNLENGGGNIVIDDAMSDTSENAVQNKVIKAYVDETVKTYVETEILGGEW